MIYINIYTFEKNFYQISKIKYIYGFYVKKYYNKTI